MNAIPRRAEALAYSWEVLGRKQPLSFGGGPPGFDEDKGKVPFHSRLHGRFRRGLPALALGI
ncbi:MAG: hypothetical protein ACUVUP_03370 [Thermaceae bacterium]